MKIPFTLAALVLLCACKKHNSGNGGNASTTPTYYKDIVINEKLENGDAAPWQYALGYFQLQSDPTTQIMVASRGTQELNDAKGFRIASINKANGVVNWVKSYDLPDQYYIQLVTCAAIDKNDNIWVGGHSYDGTGTAGILFLAELDKSGNMLWSGSLSNFQGWRAYSLAVLSSGDIAFFAKGFAGLAVLRLTTSQQLVWSTIVSYDNGTAIDDDFYGNNNITLSPENHAMVETPDGSIYVATSSNPASDEQPSADRLYQLNASGTLQFAKIYTQAFPGTTRPVQLINAGPDNLLMADQFVENGYTTATPFFNLLSLDGTLQVSRGYPLTGSFGGPEINEVNFYQGSIYFSTCGNFALDTYILDLNLNLKSAVETVADTAATTDHGGISLFDSTQNALYYVCNFGDVNPNPSNGFEVLQNRANGQSCDTTYSGDAIPLLLNNTSITVTPDTVAMNHVTSGPAPVFTSLTWRSYTVTVAATNTVCGQ
jgi:hypothetical protein